MRRLALTLAAGLLIVHAISADAATVIGTVVIDGQPAGDTIVFLEGTPGAAPQPTPAPAVMDQRNLEFVPKVLPIVAGTTVAFTNSDDIQHNVFSPSEIAGKFDLGAYGPGATRSVTFSDPGEVVILCNIHMEMEARIVVLRSPYFAVTGADGRYHIPAVPPGTYNARLWRMQFLPYNQTINVTGSGAVTLDLSLGK